MSKEAAAAILVQTLFTSDKSMQNLVMSHARIGDAKPKDVAAFIMPYYREMLKAMDSEEGEERNTGSSHDAQNSHDENDSENDETDERRSSKKLAPRS